MQKVRFRFRPGALEHIMRTRHLESESQLAAAIGVTVEDLTRIRLGTPVTQRLAMRVAVLQGDEHYLGGLFEQVDAVSPGVLCT